MQRRGSGSSRATGRRRGRCEKDGDDRGRSGGHLHQAAVPESFTHCRHPGSIFGHGPVGIQKLERPSRRSQQQPPRHRSENRRAHGDWLRRSKTHGSTVTTDECHGEGDASAPSGYRCKTDRNYTDSPKVSSPGAAPSTFADGRGDSIPKRFPTFHIRTITSSVSAGVPRRQDVVPANDALRLHDQNQN